MARAPADTKEKLIETARDLIWSASYNAISVDEICKKAGVQKGSFYHFFPSKAHLAQATLEVGKLEMTATYNDIFSPIRPPLERFELMALHLIEKQKEISKNLGHVCGCPLNSLGSELAGQDHDVAKKVTEICEMKTAYYESALRDLVSEGLISGETDIKRKAADIFAFVAGQLMLARIKNDLSYLEDNLVMALFDMIGVAGKSEISNVDRTVKNS